MPYPGLTPWPFDFAQGSASRRSASASCSALRAEGLQMVAFSFAEEKNLIASRFFKRETALAVG
jgi:hypothetical protein